MLVECCEDEMNALFLKFRQKAKQKMKIKTKAQTNYISLHLITPL